MATAAAIEAPMKGAAWLLLDTARRRAVAYRQPLCAGHRRGGRVQRKPAKAPLPMMRGLLPAHCRRWSLRFDSRYPAHAPGCGRAADGASSATPRPSVGVPCGARSRGPVAELAARPACAALRQPRRVRARGALRARAASPALLGVAQAPRHRPTRSLLNLGGSPTKLALGHSVPLRGATNAAVVAGRGRRLSESAR